MSETETKPAEETLAEDAQPATEPDAPSEESGGGFFSRLKSLFSKGDTVPLVSIGDQPHDLRSTVRLDPDSGPLCLELGKMRFHLLPDRPFGQDPSPPYDWLLYTEDRGKGPMWPFLRIAGGESVVIGRENEEAEILFDLHKSMAGRHLKIRNRRRGLIFEPLDTEKVTRLSLLHDEASLDLACGRLQNLAVVSEIFGGPFEHLPAEDANALLGETMAVLAREPYRMESSGTHLGAILDLPNKLNPVLVGDLHGQVDNLITVLCRDSLIEAMERDEACLILLGDAFHREEDDRLEDMESSVVMLDLIMRLKVRFPKNFFYLRGNHDSFSEDIGKGGVPQGVLFRKHLKDLRGKDYAKCVNDWFEALPFIVRNQHYIACHAGPVGAEVTLEMLNNVHDYPGLKYELVSTRLRGPNRPAGYRKRDVRAFRRILDVDRHCPFIVGHTPLTTDDSSWMHVSDIRYHHIVHSGDPHRFSVFTRTGEGMVALEYTSESYEEFLHELSAKDDDDDEGNEAGS